MTYTLRIPTDGDTRSVRAMDDKAKVSLSLMKWGTSNGHVIGPTWYYDVIYFAFVAKRRGHDS